MSETRQFIIFLLCVLSVLISAYTLSEVIHLRATLSNAKEGAANG